MACGEIVKKEDMEAHEFECKGEQSPVAFFALVFTCRKTLRAGKR